MTEANENTEFAPPDHLSTDAKALWSELVPSRARSPKRRVLLRVALEALDELQHIRAELQDASLVSTTKATGASASTPC